MDEIDLLDAVEDDAIISKQGRLHLYIFSQI